MRDLANLPAKTDRARLRVVVETPRGSNLKLKYEPELGVFTVSRPLTLGITYPFDWGFVPSTRASDGDPLDAMVLLEGATYPGVVHTCRALGVIRVTQNRKGGPGRERNDRVIAAAEQSRVYEGVRDFRDLPSRTRRELEQFFTDVVELEEKALRIEGWGGPEAAAALVASTSVPASEVPQER